MDPREAEAICAAASTDPELQRRAAAHASGVALTALASNPQLHPDAVPAVADAIVVRVRGGHGPWLVHEARTAGLCVALTAHPGTPPDALCGAPWLDEDDTIAALRRLDGTNVASGVHQLLARGGARRRLDREAFSALSERVRDTVAAAVAAHPNADLWRWLDTALFAVHDHIRTLGLGWVEILPATDHTRTLRNALDRLGCDSTRGLIGHLEALEHPACDAKLAADAIRRLLRARQGEETAPLYRELIARLAATHPEHLPHVLDHGVRGIPPIDDDSHVALCEAHPELAPDILVAVNRQHTEYPRTVRWILERNPTLGAELHWGQLRELLFKDHSSAPIIAESVNQLCGPNTAAAHALLANGFDGTLGELAATLEGVTAEP